MVLATIGLYNLKGLEKDTDYTLSFNAEFFGESEYISIRPYLRDGEKKWGQFTPFTTERMSVTFKTDDRFEYNLIVCASRTGQTLETELGYKSQTRKGTSATPWCSRSVNQLETVNIAPQIHIADGQTVN